MTDCIFCKIIKKEIPAKIIYEDDHIIIFNDIYPKADIHWLAIPKIHIDSMLQLTNNHSQLMGNTLVKINQIALKHGLDGYKLAVNTGVKGGQEIFHIHFHIMANK